MKKNNLIAGFILFVILTIIGCTVGGDNNVNPTDPRDKFLGTWKVSETCSRMNYDVNISADPGNSAQVLLDNFANPGTGYDPAVGLITSNTITVASQIIGEGWTVNGTGTYKSDGSISWTYRLVISASEENCTAVYTK
jgi:hypothetical protein